jgi:CheY-like chemotaxis protein
MQSSIQTGQTGSSPDDDAPVTHAHDESQIKSLKSKYIESGSRKTSDIRDLFRSLVRSSTAVGGFRRLKDLVVEVGNEARIAGLPGIGGLCESLAALLRDQIANATVLTASEQRTVAQGIELIGDLFEDARDNEKIGIQHPLILAVDDDQNARKTMIHSLRKIDYKPVVTGDCKVALHLLDENRFDLILLDIMMPDIDGFDMMQRIRENGANQGTPVIFVTGLADFNSRVKSLAAGGADFIAKPFHHLELAVKSQTLLMRRALH